MATVRSFAGMALLTAALGACALIPADKPSDQLIGEWVVEDVDHGGVIDNANLTVAFDETGRIYGSAGCNRFTGAYTYDSAFSSLKVTPLGVTRRLCPPDLMTQEHKFVQSLQSVTRAETQGDGAVALTSATGRVLLRKRDARTQAAATKTPASSTTVAPATLPAPVYDPSADPLAPKTVTPTVTTSATALPPPSTSNYPLAGGGGPLYTPTPSYTTGSGAPMTTLPTTTTSMSTAPTYTTTPAYTPPPYTPPVSTTPATTPYLTPAATPQPSRRITASGELYFLEQVTLPANATVRVQLRDVARVGAPATVLGEQSFPASGAQTYAFSVTAPVNVIAPTARLTLFAQVLSGNRLLFITDTHNPVPLEGTSTPLRVRLVNAAPAPSPTAVRPLPTPVTPTPEPVRPATGAFTGVLPATPALADIPGSTPYRCGTERFRISFEERVAYLTTADGAVARLPRIDATDDPGAPRMFSNSILTVIREAESGGRVRFARGRMALTTCSPAE